MLPESDRSQILVDYRVGDISIPKLPQTEALASMAVDFRDAVEKGTIPISSSDSGLTVVKILEAATQSIKNDGQKIHLT